MTIETPQNGDALKTTGIIYAGGATIESAPWLAGKFLETIDNVKDKFPENIVGLISTFDNMVSALAISPLLLGNLALDARDRALEEERSLTPEGTINKLTVAQIITMVACGLLPDTIEIAGRLISELSVGNHIGAIVPATELVIMGTAAVLNINAGKRNLTRRRPEKPASATKPRSKMIEAAYDPKSKKYVAKHTTNE